MILRPSRRTLLWGGVSVLLLAAVLALVPGRPTAHYRSVHDPAAGGMTIVTSRAADADVFRDHLIRDGELHLRVRTTRPTLVLTTWVAARTWAPRDVAALRAAHPELEPLWPDPGARDGGVAWID